MKGAKINGGKRPSKSSLRADTTRSNVNNPAKNYQNVLGFFVFWLNFCDFKEDEGQKFSMLKNLK